MAPNQSLGQTTSEKCPRYFFIFCLHPNKHKGFPKEWLNLASFCASGYLAYSHLALNCSLSKDVGGPMALKLYNQVDINTNFNMGRDAAIHY